MALQLDALLRADALQLKQFDLKAGAASVSATGAVEPRQDRRVARRRARAVGAARPGRVVAAGRLRPAARRPQPAQRHRWRCIWRTRRRSGKASPACTRKADLVLADSLLAGLALDGKASVDALGAPWAVSAEVHSGGNQAHVDGAISPGHVGSDALAVIDQLHLSVDAPQLQLLAPPTAQAARRVAGRRCGLGRRRAGGDEDDPRRADRQGRDQGRHAAARPTTRSALVPAVAASAASAAQATRTRRPRAASWPTRGSARLDVQVTGGRLAIADDARGHRDVARRCASSRKAS